MAPQVPQSAQLAYSLDNLMVFEPSRAPLEPSGCEPDHFKALKPDQNGRRGGQIALLDGKKRNRTAPKAILPAYERHRVVRFAPQGAQGRPGGPQRLQIPSVIWPQYAILADSRTLRAILGLSPAYGHHFAKTVLWPAPNGGLAP